MATYKKGFKKQTSEQMLLQIIVGIIIAVVVFVLIAFVYDVATRVPGYDDYGKIVKYTEIYTQEDEDENPIEKYLVYFYADTCDGCTSIAKQVLQSANRITKNGGTFLVAKASAFTEGETERDAFLTTIQRTSFSYPMLIAVVDGELAGVYIGTTAVVDTLAAVRTGTYEPFN